MGDRSPASWLLLLALALFAVAIAVLRPGDSRRDTDPIATVAAEATAPDLLELARADPAADPPERASVSRVPELVVRAEDPRGRPLDGIRVSLEAVGAQPMTPDDLISRRRTDVRGEARWSEHEVAAVFGQSLGGRLSVRLATLVEEPGMQRSLERGALPEEPLVFVLDVVEVEVIGELPDGSRFVGQHSLRLELVPGPRSLSIAGDAPLAIWMPRGKAYRARLSGADLYDAVSAQFPAVGAEEGDRQHVLRLSRELGAIVGRIVLPNGQPAPPETWVELVAPGSRGALRATDVGEDGRFRFRERTVPNARGFTGRLRATLPPFRASGEVFDVPLAFAMPDPGETRHLGDVVVSPRPVLVAGRVVAPEGVPVDRVEVRVLRRDGESLVNVQGATPWTHTDESGAFVLHGAEADGLFELELELNRRELREEFLPVGPTTVVAGSTDLLVELVPTARARFAVVATEGVDHRIDLQVVTENGQVWRSKEPYRHLDDWRDERTVEHVPAGELTVIARWSRNGPVQASLHGQISPSVQPFSDSEDWARTPFLGTLVIEPPSRFLEVGVTSSAGGPVADAVVYFGPAGSPALHRQTGSFVRIPFEGEPLDILVASDEYAPQHIEGVVDDVQSSLERLPLTRVELTGLRDLVDGLGLEAVGRELALRIERLDSPARRGLEGVPNAVALDGQPGFRTRWMDSVGWLGAVRQRENGESSVPNVATFEFLLPPGVYAASVALAARADASDDWLHPESGYAIHALGEFSVEESGVPASPVFALPSTLPLSAE